MNADKTGTAKVYDVPKRGSVRVPQQREAASPVTDENFNPNVNAALIQRNKNRYRNPLNPSSPTRDPTDTDDFTNSMNKLSIIEEKP